MVTDIFLGCNRWGGSVVLDGVPLVEGRIYMTFEEPIDISQLDAIVFDNERVEFTAAE